MLALLDNDVVTGEAGMCVEVEEAIEGINGDRKR